MIRMQLSDVVLAINASLIGADVEFNGCSTDTRTIEKDNLFIALHGENFDGHNFIEQAAEKGASSCLIDKQSEKILPTLLVQDAKHAMGLLAQRWRETLDVRIVAVTGSNGKTSVKEMVKSILSEAGSTHATSGNLNNDIGVPLTLFALDGLHNYAVIEMGANHIGEIEWLSAITKPDVAVITQCAPAHLEGFGSVDSVAKAKAEIYSGLQEAGVAVINADDDYADYWKNICAERQTCCFSLTNNQADVYASDILEQIEQKNIKFNLHIGNKAIQIKLPLVGMHNVKNALAAAACCLSLNISLELIKQGLEKLTGVKGRLQFLSGQHESRIIDDTYNANPASLAAAISVLSHIKGKRYLVLGDMGELGNTAADLHAEAGQIASKAGIDGLFTLGELSQYAQQSFGEGAIHFRNIDELNKHIKSLLGSNITILVKGSRSMKMERVVNAITEEQY